MIFCRVWGWGSSGDREWRLEKEINLGIPDPLLEPDLRWIWGGHGYDFFSSGMGMGISRPD